MRRDRWEGWRQEDEKSGEKKTGEREGGGEGHKRVGSYKKWVCGRGEEQGLKWEGRQRSCGGSNTARCSTHITYS